MQRIMIIGKSGSGKSTFGRELGKILGREVIHLDKLYWKNNWERRYLKAEWQEVITKLVAEKFWILEGNYKSTLPLRLERADTVIYFDMPRLTALYYILKRTLKSTGNSFDKQKGLKEKISLELLWLLFRYQSNKVKRMLKETKNKEIFIVKNHKQANALLKKLAERR